MLLVLTKRHMPIQIIFQDHLKRYFPEVGYKSVEEAIKEFEDYFKQDLKLPSDNPPLLFTHQFGRFSNLEGDSNDSFEVSL